MWRTLGAHKGAHRAPPRDPGSSLRSITPGGKVNGLDLGTLNASSLSLSNVFPLGGSFVREIPEVSGGLLGTLCKQTLTVGPGAWGLRYCGPDIAGDSGLRHAPAGAPCKRHDRQPPHRTPRPRTSLGCPRASFCCDLSLASSHFQVLGDTLSCGAPAPLEQVGQVGVGVRRANGAGGGCGLGLVNHLPSPA